MSRLFLTSMLAFAIIVRSDVAKAFHWRYTKAGQLNRELRIILLQWRYITSW